MVRKIHRLQRRALLVLSTLCLALSGCGADEPSTGGPKPSGEGPTYPERRAEPLSSGQIASVVTTINQGEVTQAQTALERLDHEDVRAYAEKLIRDHQAADAELVTLLVKLGVTPQESAVRVNLDDFGKQMNQTIAQESTERLAPTFLDVQIEMHRRAITTVEQLMAQTQQAELRTYLESLRGTLQGHLVHARRLRKEFPQPMESRR